MSYLGLNMNRKPLAAIALIAVVLLGFVTPSFADEKDQLEQQKKSVTGQLGDAQKSFDESSADYAKAMASLRRAQNKLDAAKATLSKTRGALAVAKAKDAEMQAKLDAAEAKLAAAELDLERGEAKVKESEAAVREFALESMREGDRGFRAFGELLKGESPAAFSERMSLNASVSDAQIATMQRLDAQRVMLGLRRDEVQDLRDQVATARQKAADNLQLKKTLEVQAAEQAASVADLVDDRKGAAADAEKIRAADAAKVEALESDRARLSAQLAELARKAQAAAQRRSGSSNGGGGGGSVAPSGGGSLSYPVNGPITSPYGMRVHPITGVYKLHDGTDFGAACGTPIYAAAGGTVIQEYYNAGYGNRLIIDHGIMRGQSVVTAYNHLSRYAVSAGANVARGQLIGYVGTTGYSTGCHLHFMVLVNGYTVNPMGWF